MDFGNLVAKAKHNADRIAKRDTRLLLKKCYYWIKVAAREGVTSTTVYAAENTFCDGYRVMGKRTADAVAAVLRAHGCTVELNTDSLGETELEIDFSSVPASYSLAPRRGKVLWFVAWTALVAAVCLYHREIIRCLSTWRC